MFLNQAIPLASHLHQPDLQTLIPLPGLQLVGVAHAPLLSGNYIGPKDRSTN